MNDIWFTSDEHHGHQNIITKFQFRPFKDVKDMTEQLIDRHNSKVRKGDRVYHLGDMFWRTIGAETALNILRRLNGQHHYILGNHDELIEDYRWLADAFVSVSESKRVDIPGTRWGVYLNHYRHTVWPHSHQGCWHLYGHSHNELDKWPTFCKKCYSSSLSFDVGVDCHDFYPINAEEVRLIMEGRSYRPLPDEPGMLERQ